MNRWRKIETPASWFLLAGTLDVVMTFLILRRNAASEGGFVFLESNPIARWVIHHWGLPGMIAFKVGLSGVVIGVAYAIVRVRPGVARALLWGGAFAAGVVVIHSVRLMVRHAG